MAFIEKGKSEAKLITSGERHGTDSLYVQPTLFFNLGKEATIYRQEIFGLVMMIKTFKTEEEAIEMAKYTEFALLASVFTNNFGKGLRMAGKIKARNVSINKESGINADTAFGGWKKSGIGREGGAYGLNGYMQEKTIKINM